MFRDNEDRPFLNKEQDTEEQQPAMMYHRRKTNKVLPPLLTFLLTSLFWLLVMLWTRPDAPARDAPSPSHEAHQSGSHKPIASDKTTHENHDAHKSTPAGVHVHPPEATYAPRHNITTNAHMISCGETPESAEANNCTYDILLNAWVPAPCFEQDWIDEYTEDMSWAAYTDETMTVQVEVEEMGKLGHYYTSKRDHVNHCAMIWKKQFWQLFEARGKYDSIMVSPGHTDHCAQYLADSADLEANATTKVVVGYAGCWIRD